MEILDVYCMFQHTVYNVDFIDKLALRFGKEKGDDETDAGMFCSLRVYITFKENITLIFTFWQKIQ